MTNFFFRQCSIASWFVALVLLTSCSVEIEIPKSFAYSGPVSEALFLMDEEDKTSTILEKNAFDAVPISMSFCDEEHSMLCFSGGHFPSFAIPKIIDSRTQNWTYDGVEFELFKKTKSAYGSNVLVIEAKENGTVTGIFIFDLEYGLSSIIYVNGMKTVEIVEGYPEVEIRDLEDVLISEGPGFGAFKDVKIFDY